jgi:GNAT superfamily N-acetyltransferase
MSCDAESAPRVAKRKSQWRETLRCWIVAGFEYAARVTAMREGHIWEPRGSGETEATRTTRHSNSAMRSLRSCEYRIRTAHPTEFSLLGELTVAVYASLPGMPTVVEQPDYYGALRDIAKRAEHPAISVFTAVSDSGELLGTVNFFADMNQYGFAGAADSISNAAGIRYLAVKPECRRSGIGRSLTTHCIGRARKLGKSAVILHTTRAMPTAWAMYERMGFKKCVEIDFQQGSLEVFGFRLDLLSTAPPFTAAPANRRAASAGFSA